MRWPENFVSLIQGKKISYETENFRDKVRIDDQDLYDFLRENVDKHEFIRENLLNATLTFYQRVKMFVKNIIMNKESPMKIKYYSYKVEFAMRGAAHIHGVLWVDLSNFDFLTKNLKKKSCTNSKVNDKDEDTVSLQSLFDRIRNEENLSPD